MQLSIRNKLVLLCVVPVILLACLITALSVTSLRHTADEQVRDTRKMLISEREHAIEHSVEVAQSVIASIYTQSAPGDMVARDRAVLLLKQLHYGKDGYYFGYDADSVRVFWADKEQQVGDSFKNFRDPNGVYVINELLRVAKDHSHYLRYSFAVPNSNIVVSKIGYALYLEKWNLMIGSAVNLADLDAQVAEVASDLKNRIEALIGFIIGLSILSSVLLTLLATWLISRLLLPLRDLRNQLDQVAAGNGDLTHRLPVVREDELGQLALSFNRFVEKIHGIVRHVVNMTAQLNALVLDVAAQAQRSESAVSLQRQETDQVAAAINQLSAAALQVARSAQEAARAATEATDEGHSANLVVQASVANINALVGNLEVSGTSLGHLQGEVKSIVSVLAVIRSIAEQTNLLALNAAIEAARAGDAGRGFAVVADEVRALAGRTQSSTQEIQTMIDSLERGTTHTVQAMQQSREAGSVTRDQAAHASASLLTIGTLIGTIDSMNTQIASAAEEQTAVAEEINRSVQGIVLAVDNVAQETREGAQTARNLAALSENLNAAVKQFRV